MYSVGYKPYKYIWWVGTCFCALCLDWLALIAQISHSIHFAVTFYSWELNSGSVAVSSLWKIRDTLSSKMGTHPDMPSVHNPWLFCSGMRFTSDSPGVPAGGSLATPTPPADAPGGIPVIPVDNSDAP